VNSDRGRMTSRQAWTLGLASLASFMMALDSQVVMTALGVFGVAVTVAVFASVGGYESAEEFSAGFTAAMGAVAAFAFIGTLAALGMPGKRPVAAPMQETSAVPQT
jgi:hypothetical protein